MALKSVTILLLVVAPACFAAPPAEDEAPASENANQDALVFETAKEEAPTTEHLDVDSTLENLSQTDVRLERRAASTEEKVCGKKSGGRATCVLYFLCKTTDSEEDVEPECSSYFDTCCLDSERVVDIMHLVDIQ